jgi:hypothetical protein
MYRPRLIRGLRIAVSAVCGILCVLLIVLWVRSYWWFDIIYYRPTASTLYRAQIEDGVVRFQDCSPFALDMGHQPVIGWSLEESWYAGYAIRLADVSPFKRAFKGFEAPNQFGWQVPHCVLLLSTIALGAFPWFRAPDLSFSLRTLLIATTLIAVLLATAAYLRLW